MAENPLKSLGRQAVADPPLMHEIVQVTASLSRTGNTLTSLQLIVDVPSTTAYTTYEYTASAVLLETTFVATFIVPADVAVTMNVTDVGVLATTLLTVP